MKELNPIIMLLKCVSRKVRRVKDFDCEIWVAGSYFNMVAMNIEFKVLGFFWVVGKSYTYIYWDN